MLFELANASSIYSRLVGILGLYFVGAPRGVLPIGLNGIPGFHTAMDADILSDPSHNYTVELQGIGSNVTCTYEAQSLIDYYADSPYLWQYNGTCPPGQDFLPDPIFIAPPSNDSLGFWACRTAQSGNSYTVYLRGIANYATSIGNITCAVSPIRPAVFSVNYTGLLGAFSIQEQISTSPNASVDLAAWAVEGLGSTIWEAQNLAKNTVADSVTNFGVQYLDLPQDQQNETYLRIFEAMIQGMLDYEVRSIYCHLFVFLCLGSEYVQSLPLLGASIWVTAVTTVVHALSPFFGTFRSVRLECHTPNCRIFTPDDNHQLDFIGGPGCRYVYRQA